MSSMGGGKRYTATQSHLDLVSLADSDHRMERDGNKISITAATTHAMKTNSVDQNTSAQLGQ
jgi:hypothetical protein